MEIYSNENFSSFFEDHFSIREMIENENIKKVSELSFFIDTKSLNIDKQYSLNIDEQPLIIDEFSI